MKVNMLREILPPPGEFPPVQALNKVTLIIPAVQQSCFKLCWAWGLPPLCLLPLGSACVSLEGTAHTLASSFCLEG